MKNVFKRCLKLLTLFSSNNETLTTNFIKDNVAEYRELGDSAFKRSFERDKALLKEMGFLLDFENDKWKINDGYKLTGTKIFDDIKMKAINSLCELPALNWYKENQVEMIYTYMDENDNLVTTFKIHSSKC